MTRPVAPPADFRVRATIGVAGAALLLLAPFALNNFVQGRPFLGVGASAIVLIMAGGAWAASRGHYDGRLLFAGQVPAILVFLSLAYQRQDIIGVLWTYPALLAFYCTLPERMAWTANVALLAVVLPQAWTQVPHDVAIRTAATLVATSVFAAIFVRVITVQQEELEALAATDPLTGLDNRALLPAALAQAMAHARRKQEPVTLVSLDLDRFKAINDTLGHGAGDQVLKRVAELVRKRVRRADRVFRVGGEEFLVLMVGSNGANAQRVAEELRASVAESTILPGRAVTVSIGVAQLDARDDAQAWLERADQRLYQAKAAGRNTVVV